EERLGETAISVVQLRVRVANWLGDIDTMKRYGLLATAASESRFHLLRAFVLARIGELDVDEVARGFQGFLDRVHSPRYAALVHQLLAEAHAGCGRLDAAMASVLEAQRGQLVDIEWLDRCPVLAPL